jgi:hypothetical protein
LNGGAGSNGLVIDASNNVGIGTSSPAYKLDISGQFRVNPAAGGASVIAQNTGGSAAIELIDNAATPNRWWLLSGLGSPTDGIFSIYDRRQSVSRLAIDTSGNLGLGVAPSGWISSRRASQIGGTYSALGFAGSAATSEIITNAYWNTSGQLTRINTGYVGYMDFNNYSAGGFTWQIGGSGAAGATVTPTQAMTLDASGNLLVGNTVTNPVGARSNGTSIHSNGTTDIRGPANTSVWGMSATSGDFIRFYTDNGSANVYCGSLVGSGNTFSIYSVSDQRLKTNVAPSGSAIKSVLDFPVDQFDWISSGEHQDFGAVAQKVFPIIPEMVSVPTDDDEMWGIDWSKAVPRLIKTIQEMHQELQTLKAKVN